MNIEQIRKDKKQLDKELYKIQCQIYKLANKYGAKRYYSWNHRLCELATTIRIYEH